MMNDLKHARELELSLNEWIKEYGRFSLKWIGDESVTKPDIEFIDWVDAFAERIAYRDKGKKIDPVTTSQLRKLFGEVRRIQLQLIGKKGKLSDSDRLPIQMLKAQLAYAEGRAKSHDRKNRIVDFRNQLEIPLDKIIKSDETNTNNTKEAFDLFVTALEAIVAYHKLHYKEK